MIKAMKHIMKEEKKMIKRKQRHLKWSLGIYSRFYCLWEEWGRLHVVGVMCVSSAHAFLSFTLCFCRLILEDLVTLKVSKIFSLWINLWIYEVWPFLPLASWKIYLNHYKISTDWVMKKKKGFHILNVCVRIHFSLFCHKHSRSHWVGQLKTWL